MKIKPLRDLIVAVHLEKPGKVGLVITPLFESGKNQTHVKALVLASGPQAMDDCPPGTVIHVTELWGDKLQFGERTALIGRLRDVNGICVGERVADTNRYMD